MYLADTLNQFQTFASSGGSLGPLKAAIEERTKPPLQTAGTAYGVAGPGYSFV